MNETQRMFSDINTWKGIWSSRFIPSLHLTLFFLVFLVWWFWFFYFFTPFATVSWSFLLLFLPLLRTLVLSSASLFLFTLEWSRQRSSCLSCHLLSLLLGIQRLVSHDYRLLEFYHEISRFGTLLLRMGYKRNCYFSREVHLCQDWLNDSSNERSAVETSFILWDWNEFVHKGFVFDDVVCCKRDTKKAGKKRVRSTRHEKEQVNQRKDWTIPRDYRRNPSPDDTLLASLSLFLGSHENSASFFMILWLFPALFSCLPLLTDGFTISRLF